MNRLEKLNELRIAEKKADILFREIKDKGVIQYGVTEKETNLKIYNLAYQLFGIKKYWHKRIIRAGKNTLLPYRHNPPNLIVQKDDIVFIDFGPVFDEWEADYGRTYVLGNNKKKLKLKKDIESAWAKGQKYYQENKSVITGRQLYEYSKLLAQQYGWMFGNEHCGHLIGKFPHKKLYGKDIVNYIHPENNRKMSELDKNGNERFWIYEIHFIDQELEIGGFFEQLLD